MRARLEQWFHRRWYEGVRPGFLLRCLAGLQSVLVRLNRRRRRTAWRAPVPVVVIGNLTVGGTGKTPFTAWLARRLSEAGLSVGIVSRGYGRRSRRVLLVDVDSDWRDVGDEPLLLHRLTGACPVAVGRDRVAACRELLRQAPVDLILCDDGLQHYRLARELEVALVDADRGFGNGLLFPAGPLREPLARLDEVDFQVWKGKRPDGASGAEMRFSLGEAVRLSDGERRPLTDFAPGPVRAVAGIASPQRFFDSLEQYGIRVRPEYPGDHGAWHERAGDELTVLMTDKDAVKLSGPLPSRWWRVPVVVEVRDGDVLLERIVALCRPPKV